MKKLKLLLLLTALAMSDFTTFAGSKAALNPGCKANMTCVCYYDYYGNCTGGTCTYTPAPYTLCVTGTSSCTQSTSCTPAANTQPVTVSCCSTTP